MKRPRHKRFHKKRRARLLAALAAVCIAALCIGTATLSRYVLKREERGLATPAGFYFESDYLKESEENAFYFIDPKTSSFQIALYNSADLERRSETDINYTVTAEGADVADSANGVLKKNEKSTALLTITPRGTEDKFTVTAQATAPYQKTLTATFQLALGNRYQVEDAVGNTAAVLTMTCIDNGGPVALSLPGGVVPDATDDRVTAAADGYTFQAPGPGVYSLVLLKTTPSVNLSQDDTDFADKIVVNSK